MSSHRKSPHRCIITVFERSKLKNQITLILCLYSFKTYDSFDLLYCSGSPLYFIFIGSCRIKYPLCCNTADKRNCFCPCDEDEGLIRASHFFKCYF